MEIEVIEEEGKDKKKNREAMKKLAALLAEPFPPYDIEWRIARAGRNQRGTWAQVLAYVTNRGIMQRLDDVCGIDNWKNEYEHLTGFFQCGIAIRLNGEWVWKYDGAQETNIESIKGGYSGSMKRAAVQWGIGRYLYKLSNMYADIKEGGRFWQGGKQGSYDAFNWDPPKLPEWALPSLPEGNNDTI